MTSSSNHIPLSRFFGAFAVVVLGTVLAASFCQTCLSSRPLSANFVSPRTWMALVTPKTFDTTAPPDSVQVPFSRIALPCLMVSLSGWIIGALILAWRRELRFTDALIRWGWHGWWWWCLIDVWEWIWIAAAALNLRSVSALLSVTPQIWLAICLAIWLTTWTTIRGLARTNDANVQQPISTRYLWLACGIYILVFTTMNWRLYFNLLVPHGDSVMYEEHLWNILHGKGFRSYLDRGLFLGEHIQFVHLFLLPLYVLWPSHLLLEVCSSTALACGAFPVYWMVRRKTNSDQAAFAVAIAYLLYAPMQFLDIEIDLKTFRPESFGIPLLLLALDQLDRNSVRGTVAGIIACLTVKEDYSVIFGPLGLWIALSRPSDSTAPLPGPSTSQAFQFDLRRQPFRRMFGLGLAVFSVAYLWVATRVVMPWFRSGDEIHYASYLSRFGTTPEQIIKTMVTSPNLVFDSIMNLDTALYATAMLAPLAFLPLFAPGRLFVGLPLFGILCLNQLEQSRTPQHQFHAPLVGIAFWALAAASPTATTNLIWFSQRFGRKTQKASPSCALILGHLVWTSSLMTGLFFSLSPLGVPFWDPNSSWNWQRLYGPSQRSKMFARIATTIPTSARVASTDFVHPRFTHHAFSYDYSDYKRKISGAGNRIPDDTDYLVIDTKHKYSKIERPTDVPEFKEHPERWELLPDTTDGYFIVLKRKRIEPGTESLEGSH